MSEELTKSIENKPRTGDLENKLDLLKKNKNVIYNALKPTHIKFSNLNEFSHKLQHGFSTRLGGKSTGDTSYLNLNFGKTDSREIVYENYEIICEELGIDIATLVFSRQLHGENILSIHSRHKGNGILRKNEFEEVDSIVTDEKGITLVTFYADCVPVLFYHPIKEVIGAVHSGWRGTLKDISVKTARYMNENYNTTLQDFIVTIGPSIRSCCFEVGEEVVDQFKAVFHDFSKYVIMYGDKHHLDLQGFIRDRLISEGISSEKISDSGICTKCNKEVFYSHRGDMGKGGTMAAFLQLKPSNGNK